MPDTTPTPKRLILCAGIPRSGSTWLYNVVRLVMAAPGGEAVYGCWVEDHDRAHPAPIHVVKIHDPDADLRRAAEAVLLTRRDLRDIAASHVRRGWVEPGPALIARLEEIVAMHAWWRSPGAIELEYGEIVRDPVRAIGRIMRPLSPGLGDHHAARIHEEVRALRHQAGGDRPYDAVNLLHPEHIRDGREGGYRDVLSSATIAAIEQRFGAWLAEHGYETAPAR